MIKIPPFLSSVAGSILNLLLPPLCANCDQVVGNDQALCAACWNKITFISPPCCACCGTPFDYDMGDAVMCGACMEKEPIYAMARSALVYDDGSKGMILRFKHADRHHTAKSFALWMKRAGGAVLDSSDMLVPVPLHRWRLFFRRANQSALLAKALSDLTEKEMIPDLLRRVKRTPSQGHLSRKQREKNVKNAFKVTPRYKESIKGKTILLIDDVLTTGATVNACAQALLDAGANKVNVLTLARTRRAV